MGDPIYRYMMIVVACVALLIGLQVPNFVDQYQKRVDAHLREVTINLLPFQALADKYFSGDMDKLVALHRSSGEKPFQEEGSALEQMMQRKLRFEADLAALNVNLVRRVWHVLVQPDTELFEETLVQYSYALPLKQDALTFAAGFVLSILLLVESLLALVRFALRRLAARSNKVGDSGKVN
jgi:hypothetical protein